MLNAAWAAGSTRFEPAVQIAGTELQRNGSGTRLIEIFSGRSKPAPGESFAMDFLPGKGTRLCIAGQAQGEPVGDAEFFGLVLGIWFGPSPADRMLKDALRGQE